MKHARFNAWFSFTQRGHYFRMLSYEVRSKCYLLTEFILFYSNENISGIFTFFLKLCKLILIGLPKLHHVQVSL
jgi:hypothetical protein